MEDLLKKEINSRLLWLFSENDLCDITIALNVYYREIGTDRQKELIALFGDAYKLAQSQ